MKVSGVGPDGRTIIYDIAVPNEPVVNKDKQEEAIFQSTPEKEKNDESKDDND